ncbi:hypothetical protein PoB_000530800 [Plakobranchus ocellatus]|uniref:Uncharacterized protein n=1 Tax=Plakobranchus ocellatus TaxID=259542 RepID=A0AAV3Y9H3_9GAST|nr:hypothetical protein PoB_000530800 [Plakobranchus ocellatus]
MSAEMVQPANLTKEEKDFLGSARNRDAYDEEKTEEEIEKEGYGRSAPSTPTSLLSVPEAATYDSTYVTIMDEPLHPTTSATVSTIDNLRNASEYYRKKN